MPRSKSKNRPAATTAVTQPIVEDSSARTTLSAFSENGGLFALLSPAVDKHRLRVHDTATGSSTAEYVVQSSRVTALEWANVLLSPEVSEPGSPPQKKRRKKQTSASLEGAEVVVLGLADGTIELFSPSHGCLIQTLSHPTCSASILSTAVSPNRTSLWTSASDGVTYVWDLQKSTIVGSWKNEDRIPFSTLSFRPTDDEEDLELLAASHRIRLLYFADLSDLNEAGFKPDDTATFSGHASPISILKWDASQTPPTRFISAAEGDRVISIWEVPDEEEEGAEGTMVASVPLDASPRALSLFTGDDKQKQAISTLDSSGKLSIIPIPSEISAHVNSSKMHHSTPTLLAQTTISVKSKKVTTSSKIIDAAFFQPGQILVARLVGGVQPVFNVVDYLDGAGGHILEVKLDDVKPELVSISDGVTQNRRYAEGSSVAVGSGLELGQDEQMDDIADRNVDGELDADLAELSLGQRLTAMSGKPQASSSSEEDEADEIPGKTTSSRRKGKQAIRDSDAVPANSLTRTLIQALHSSDSRLLETCLAHSDETLIRNTVRRLPPQLAVPLITACVERLGRGSRSSNMKGRGGGASAQRGTTMIKWVKTVLVIHSGHLMSMPDLVARLAGLHSTLTTRLALKDSLLSLSGRLDMVLSQIEMRSSGSPASLDAKGKDSRRSTEVTRYVEGESEDDDMADVEVEKDDEDEGSIEDVALGGDEEFSEEESDEEDEEEDDESDEGPTLNGFIDDEAEEYSDDEDEDDSE